jgi:hypothetical protein
MVNVRGVFLFVIFDGEFAGCSPIGKQPTRFAIGVLITRRPAQTGIYGNSKEEAFYAFYDKDADGQPFDGDKGRYVLRFAPGQLLLSVGQTESVRAAPPSSGGAEPRFPKPVEEYHDEQIPGIMAKLAYRIQAEPLNLVAALIFLGAIVHTFLASKFMLIAHRLEH